MYDCIREWVAGGIVEYLLDWRQNISGNYMVRKYYVCFISLILLKQREDQIHFFTNLFLTRFFFFASYLIYKY